MSKKYERRLEERIKYHNSRDQELQMFWHSNEYHRKNVSIDDFQMFGKIL